MPRRDDPGFDDDIVRFVVSDLRTVWALELLLLMKGAPDRVWTDVALTAELRANLGMVGEILKRLQTLGLGLPRSQRRTRRALRAHRGRLSSKAFRDDQPDRARP